MLYAEGARKVLGFFTAEESLVLDLDLDFEVGFGTAKECVIDVTEFEVLVVGG